MNINLPFKKYLNSKYFKYDLLIHITFLILIFVILFLFVISKMEKKGLLSEIKIQLHNHIDNNIKNKLKIIKNTKQTELETIKNIVNNKTNTVTYWYNKKLKTILITILIFTLIIFVVNFYSAINNKNITVKNFFKLLLENLLTFLLIGMIEMIFFLNVGIKYVPLKSTFIVNKFIENVNNLI